MFCFFVCYLPWIVLSTNNQEEVAVDFVWQLFRHQQLSKMSTNDIMLEYFLLSIMMHSNMVETMSFEEENKGKKKKKRKKISGSVKSQKKSKKRSKKKDQKKRTQHKRTKRLTNNFVIHHVLFSFLIIVQIFEIHKV